MTKLKVNMTWRTILFVLAFTHLLFQGVLAQKSCSSTKYCFTVNLSANGSFVNFVMEAPTSFGWVGLGIGDSMITSYLMIAWPNSDGTVTLSQRRTSTYSEPKLTNQQSDLVVDTAQSGVKGDNFVVAFKRAVSVNGNTITTTGIQNFIWSTSNTRPSDKSPGTTLVMHSDRGHSSFALVAGNSNVTYVSSSSSLSTVDKFVISHGVIMTVAWLVAAPTAIFIARFGRRAFAGTSLSWFHLHWSIQVFVTSVFSAVGYILIHKSGYQSASAASHSYIGKTIVYGTIGQLVLGIVQRKLFRPDRGYIPWWTHLHWWVGRSLVILAFAEVPLGFMVYGIPDVWYIVYYVYLGVLIFAFFAGSIILWSKEQNEKQRLAVKANDPDEMSETYD